MYRVFRIMRTHRPWTEAEVHFLEVNYGFMPFRDIVIYLSSHTEASIRLKACERGLTMRQYSPADYNHPRYKNMTIKEQAYAMGVAYGTVWRWRRGNKNCKTI